MALGLVLIDKLLAMGCWLLAAITAPSFVIGWQLGVRRLLGGRGRGRSISALRLLGSSGSALQLRLLGSSGKGSGRVSRLRLLGGRGRGRSNSTLRLLGSSGSALQLRLLGGSGSRSGLQLLGGRGSDRGSRALAHKLCPSPMSTFLVTVFLVFPVCHAIFIFLIRVEQGFRTLGVRTI